MVSESIHPDYLDPSAREETQRAAFIRRTYAHVAGAVLVFAVLEGWLLSLPFAKVFLAYALNRYVWLAILLGFMAVGQIADSWARSKSSLATQYFGLGLYVAAEALLFVPLLTMAKMVSPDIIPIAAVLSVVLTGGLTLICFTTRRNFSGLRSALCIGGFIAMGLILASCLFGFGLGLLFSAAMVVLASGSILYNTSCIIHEFDTRQHVAAALSLFAAVALLFWYIVRILIRTYLASQSK